MGVPVVGDMSIMVVPDLPPRSVDMANLCIPVPPPLLLPPAPIPTPGYMPGVCWGIYANASKSVISALAVGLAIIGSGSCNDSPPPQSMHVLHRVGHWAWNDGDLLLEPP